MRKPYPSDLTDEQWEVAEPLIPANQLGRPREVEMREVLNAIFYVLRSGCPWDMLPHDLPPKSTVYDYVMKPRPLAVRPEELSAIWRAFFGFSLRSEIRADRHPPREHRVMAGTEAL
jgi:transposase